jgi:hypothetical protein
MRVARAGRASWIFFCPGRGRGERPGRLEVVEGEEGVKRKGGSGRGRGRRWGFWVMSGGVDDGRFVFGKGLDGMGKAALAVAEIGGTVRHSIWCLGRESCKPLGLAGVQSIASRK